VSAKKSMQLLCTDNAKALDPESYMMYSFSEWMDINNDQQSSEKNITTEKLVIPIPEILILTNDIKYKFKDKARFSKNKVFTRDKHLCGYCLRPVTSSDRTIDHVVPISKGGKTNFQNTVTACKKCNKKKADRTLNEIGWQLHHKLTEPSNDIFYKLSENRILESWKTFIQ